MPGHFTNACFPLRHAIQDLIDCGIILPPSPPKVTIFKPIIPENQPQPTVPIPFEPEDSLLAAVCVTEVFTADIWIDSDEGLANERADQLRSIDQRSTK
ncbi:hypothetical protein RHMOL_Rhmol03G0133200 [Rhododendron molle]|uniref:Uncharacterized protein n=1 Tax=Rhododendron molle TaxID=49168 RepID=A0ACC0PDM0_RHOML|nr:hypothetical protein RHMOL_Rhmol03G0133200 [Rhododendron molle]